MNDFDIKQDAKRARRLRLSAIMDARRYVEKVKQRPAPETAAKSGTEAPPGVARDMREKR